MKVRLLKRLKRKVNRSIIMYIADVDKTSHPYAVNLKMTGSIQLFGKYKEAAEFLRFMRCVELDRLLKNERVKRKKGYKNLQGKTLSKK